MPSSVEMAEALKNDPRKYPKNYGKFLDIVEILNRAIATSGAEITCESPTKATSWIQRANTLRARMREANGGFSDWDMFTFTVERDPVTKKAISPIVMIEFRRPTVKVKYFDPESDDEQVSADLPPPKLEL